ncbi:hypothetical protein BKA65DRAFT_56938 [Rhexocercosporidium sp. MPI-PUGE-AT-0058]|nr:hypothetical protein BKA65DRAFT_56938 [Rhexocercosporidium sp. MPI-PUGE-AT-0058]
MLTTRATLTRSIRQIRRFYSSQNVLPPVQTILGPLDLIEVEEFREKAFAPEKPLLITARDGRTGEDVKPLLCSIPAADKWFVGGASGALADRLDSDASVILSQEYLTPYGDTILPYELITPNRKDLGVSETSEISSLLKHYLQYSDGTIFHRFSAPLSLFLLASKTPHPPALYIAQAQLLDLPPPLRADLPIPHLVSQAGKGDIYDSNLWMGIPPTYTPLHKDPNPNLFVQLASRKRVRMFEPRAGLGIFREVQEGIGRAGHGGAIRGNEMMEGPERDGLYEAVWGEGLVGREGGFETSVGPGDALFIPKGWWHSFRSVGDGVTGSVNWWFR